MGQFTFGFDVAKVGLFYHLNSVPCVSMSAFAGPLGNRFGRSTMVFFGLLVQGLSTMLWPKNVLAINAISMVGIGIGMGIVDGATPALLSDVAGKLFQGTGKVFVLSNAGVQLGFVIGPILGNALFGAYGFSTCCGIFGLVLVAYAPVIYQRRKLRLS